MVCRLACMPINLMVPMGSDGSLSVLVVSVRQFQRSRAIKTTLMRIQNPRNRTTSLPVLSRLDRLRRTVVFCNPTPIPYPQSDPRLEVQDRDKNASARRTRTLSVCSVRHLLLLSSQPLIRLGPCGLKDRLCS